MARGGRKRLGVDLTPEAFEAWHAFGKGVSATALLEVLGMRLHRRRLPPEVRQWLETAIEQARTIDEERNRSGGRRPAK